MPSLFTQIEGLPTPEEIVHETPSNSATRHHVMEARQTVKRICNGEDSRLLLIVGPCSIHDPQAAKEYAQRLSELAKRTQETLFVVMRTYFEKPRTALGWKGFLYDPWLDGSGDILSGIRGARRLLLEINEMGLPCATEFLDPSIPLYLGDLITWGCVGARTTASQLHRQMASGLAMPIGFKNTTDGDIQQAINAVRSAQSPHTFLGINHQGRLSAIRSQGNAYAHVVLRGGRGCPNFDSQSLTQTAKGLKRLQHKPFFLVDCSHDNSRRDHRRQEKVFKEIVEQWHPRLSSQGLKGLMLESHLKAGNQPLIHAPKKLRYAVSITDPCLGWEATEALLLYAHEWLKPQVEIETPTPIGVQAG